MNTNRLSLVFCFPMFLAPALAGQPASAGPTTGTPPLPAAGAISPSSSTGAASDTRMAVEDDLEWLVGRWKRVTRQYFDKPTQMTAPYAEASRASLNVYFP